MIRSQQEVSSLYEVLEPRLTSVRLAPYLVAAGSNRRDAIRLYQWNIELSGTVYEALHVFDVVLRNTMDVQLCTWNANQIDTKTGRPHSAEWLLDPAPLLRRLVGGQDFAKARFRASRAVKNQRRSAGHADLLAQMSFGTWRFLLPGHDPGRQYLWDHALQAAFPYLDRKPHELTILVNGIYHLRNRVAHLEPLLRSDNVREQFLNMRAVLSEIDPVIEQWFVSRQRVTSVLRARP